MTMGPEGAKCDAPGLNLRPVPISVDQTAMMPNLPFGKGEFLHHAGRIEPMEKPIRANVVKERFMSFPLIVVVASVPDGLEPGLRCFCALQMGCSGFGNN